MRTPSSAPVDRPQQILCEKGRRCGYRRGIADAFFGAACHHRAESLRSGGEQRIEIGEGLAGGRLREFVVAKPPQDVSQMFGRYGDQQAEQGATDVPVGG